MYSVKARRNTYGSYKKSLPCGVPPPGTILHGENEVFHFQRNRNDFPKVSFTLDVI
jgi:hypothetical protein